MSLLKTLPCPGPVEVSMTTPEFTFIGAPDQPDFAQLTISYLPAARIVELKSLKKYLQSFRGRLYSYERIVTVLWADLNEVIEPTWLRVELACQPRGGMRTTVWRAS